MFHFLSSSVLAALPVAVGDGVGAERGGSSVGLCQGALLVGTCHAPSLPKICVVLETPQTSRPASQKGGCPTSLKQARKWFEMLQCLYVLYLYMYCRIRSVSSPIAEHFVLMSQFRQPVPRMSLFLVFVQIVFRFKSWPSFITSFLSGFNEYFQRTISPLSSLLQGDYTAAMASLETCLSVLTRAFPSSNLDLVCSLSWNLIRYCLHRPVPLGWLVHQVRGKHEGEEARTSARDAALVYHRLSQLQLSGKRGVQRGLMQFTGCCDMVRWLKWISAAEYFSV